MKPLVLLVLASFSFTPGGCAAKLTAPSAVERAFVKTPRAVVTDAGVTVVKPAGGIRRQPPALVP